MTKQYEQWEKDRTRRKLDYFDKMAKVRKLIDERFPDKEGDEIMTMLCHIAHWHYDKQKSNLMESEYVLYNMLIKGNYNPSTVYKWFLLTKTPDDIRGRIKRREISQKQALAMSNARRNKLKVSRGLDLLEDIRTLVMRL